MGERGDNPNLSLLVRLFAGAQGAEDSKSWLVCDLFLGWFYEFLQSHRMCYL